MAKLEDEKGMPSGKGNYTCTVAICSAFGDVERINDRQVRCNDHGTVFESPVEVRPEKADETSSKTLLDDTGDQL